jgi:predicted enzyme related to lactoylglutathione lyase
VSAEILVNIDVDDLEPAVEFYASALGFTVGRRLGAAGVELLGASSAIYLLPKARGSAPIAGISVTRDYTRHWTPVHLDFVVEDIGAAVARARGAGARQEGEVARNVWGDLAMFSDPFGHGFCLIEFRNRGYDEIAT